MHLDEKETCVEKLIKVKTQLLKTRYFSTIKKIKTLSILNISIF